MISKETLEDLDDRPAADYAVQFHLMNIKNGLVTPDMFIWGCEGEDKRWIKYDDDDMTEEDWKIEGELARKEWEEMKYELDLFP